MNGHIGTETRSKLLREAAATPINGLWAVGADAGGMYGKAYVDFEGGTLGFAYTSGRLAGEDAAHYAKTH